MAPSLASPQDNGVPDGLYFQKSYEHLFPQGYFRFDDDVWDLNFRATTASPPSYNRISFAAIDNAVKYDVKEYIIHGIYGAGLSNSWASQTMVVLRKALQFLVEKHGPPFSLLALTRDDARSLEEHLSQSGRKRIGDEISTVARFAVFLRQKYQGEPAEFRLNPRAAPASSCTERRTYSEGLEQVIPDEVSSALMEAVGREQLILEERTKHSKARLPTTQFLYTVVLALLLYSGRRISEVLLLRQCCLREPTGDEITRVRQKGIWLIYHNTKGKIDEQEVFMGEPGASLVREMVERARMLTESLAIESGLDRLFLTDSKSRFTPGGKSIIRPLNSASFISWLNGRVTQDKQVERAGFIQRHNIRYYGEYYQLDPHQARHTVAHKAYLGGASYADVGDHLHHKRTIAGLSPMTGVYLHGLKKDVELIRQMNSNRTVVGKAAPLIDNRLVVLNNLSAFDVTIWQEQGMVLHPTLYGH
jgi:integrase